MNPEEERELLEQTLEEILAGVREMLSSGQRLSDEVQSLLADEINATYDRITELNQVIQQAPPIEQPIPQGADLLWILSGANPQTFTEYLTTFPDPELNALASNRVRLNQVIEELSRRVTLPAGEQADGIPRANLQSSNVYGFKYDPRKKEMFVKFQGNKGLGQGSVYRYENVPPPVAKIVLAGAVPAKTKGQNRWGRWWKSKQPSIGASTNALLVKGGFPYTRIN